MGRLACDLSSIPDDLDWIVMKALEKDRARRYDSASGLGQDIRRFLSQEPVSAGPPSAAYRFRKLCGATRPAWDSLAQWHWFC